MRVLITGHLGYIGPIMIRTFKRAGHFVVGLDTGYFRDCQIFDDKDTVPDAEIVRDIRSIEIEHVAGFDCIVHLAALSNDPMGELAPELTMQINFDGSVRVARLARETGVKRFVFASSCSLYGASNTDAPLTENASFNPVSAYAMSKVNTELALRQLADESFTPVFLRNATAYGVSPRMRFDLVLNNLVAWAKTTGRVRVTSDGTPWRPLVHIEDISLAAVCAAEAPQEVVHNQAFNIGRNDANYQIRDIANAVARQVVGANVEITGETSGDLRSYRVSFEKAAALLPGFSPQWTIERGCVELDTWLSNRAETADSFQSRQFIRLKQLKHLISTGTLDESLFWLSVSRGEGLNTPALRQP
jgi:nucleoside-diphosphate-sugar epimerase